MKKLVCASLALIAAGLAPSAALAACASLSTLPATISAPGQYCLAKDYSVNMTTGNLIVIASNGVSLDCAGHALRNSASSASASSNAITLNSRNDVVIKNCRIVGGFNTGINVVQNNSVGNKNYYVTIDNNYIAGPTLHGIRAYGSAIEITNNRIYDIGGQLNENAYGIRLGGSTTSNYFKFHVVRDNLVAGTNSPYLSAYGIFSEGSWAGIFTGNTISGTSAGNPEYGAYGFRIGGGMNRVTGNHVVSGGDPDNDFGVYTLDTDSSCYDNYIRAMTPVANCNATLGNY